MLKYRGLQTNIGAQLYRLAERLLFDLLAKLEVPDQWRTVSMQPRFRV